MKQFTGKLLWCGVIFGIFLLAGCHFSSGEENGKNPPEEPLQASHSDMETVSIYTIDSDSMTLVPATVIKSQEEMSPTYITSLIEDCLEDDENIVYSVEQKDDTVILSFYKNKKPITNCSRKMESLILDCFANSLLDNVENCNKVIFRCEDRPYKSHNYSFKINDVYASK